MNHTVHTYWCSLCTLDTGPGIKWPNSVEVWGWNGAGHSVGEPGGGGLQSELHQRDRW